MESTIKEAILASGGQLKDWALSSIGQTMHWLIGLILQTIGWPGIVGIAAASLLLLSLSARAVRFLHSPRGMAFSAAIMCGGLACSWWLWPQMAAAASSSQLANNSLADRQATTALPGLEKLSESPEPLAVQAVATPKRPKAKSKPLDLPPLVFNAVPLAIPPLPMPVMPLPHVPPPVVVTHQPIHHPLPAPPRTVVSPVHPGVAVARPPLGNGRLPIGGSAGFLPGMQPGPGQHSPIYHAPHLTPLQRQALAFQQIDHVINSMMQSSFHGGGMHPIGGMGHSSGHAVQHGGHVTHHTGHH